MSNISIYILLAIALISHYIETCCNHKLSLIMEGNFKVKSDNVVVSGISGRFPKSRNMKEFAANLYNKTDMIDDDESRWKHFHPEVPRRFGKIGDLEKFDAIFFSVLEKSAATMDPQARMLLEHSYEAILDSGTSPQSLIGSRTGVFVAFNGTDSKDAFFHNLALNLPPNHKLIIFIIKNSHQLRHINNSHQQQSSKRK